MPGIEAGIALHVGVTGEVFLSQDVGADERIHEHPDGYVPCTAAPVSVLLLRQSVYATSVSRRAVSVGAKESRCVAQMGWEA